MKLNIKNTDKKYVFEGWGTSLCWWAHMIGQWENESKIDEICDLLFSLDSGLGINILRYNFGAGANPPNLKNMRCGGVIPSYGIRVNEWDMKQDFAQRKILIKAMERGEKILEAFFNSPPIWMLEHESTAGAVYGENNLKKEQEKNFAEYMCENLKKMQEVYGIKFDSISPFNEPSSIWWTADNDQEGCHYSVSSQRRIIKYLKGFIDLSELYPIAISGPEGWSVIETISMYNDMGEDTRKSIDQINTHTYMVDNRSRAFIRKLAQRDEKKLWMSEVCLASENPHNHNDVDTGIMIARAIIDDLNIMKPSAWVYWQALENEDLKHNYGFLHGTFTGDEKYYISKSYYYFMQFTKFIRPGMELLDADSDNATAAFDKDNNRVVIVILNETDDFKEEFIEADFSIKQVDAYETTLEKSFKEKDYKIENNFIKIKAEPKSVITLCIQITDV